MDRSEPPSTQSSAQHQSILVNAQGAPLKVNLQAVELEGRPKLVRTLKSSGALVVSNAKEAAIILVDSASESGKRLIRTWGHDASKVVLEYTWLRTSIDAGRPLLEADNWGGAMAMDDGRPVTIDGVVVDEDELEEVEALVTKSPLPTPRVTPVDPTSQRLENAAIERPDATQFEPNTSRTEGLPLPAPPMAQPAVVNTPISKEPTADTVDDGVPAQSPLPSATQPLPYLQPSAFVQPSQSQSTYGYAPFTTQQPYPPSQPFIMSAQPFPHPGRPPSQTYQPQMVHAPSAPHTPSVQSPMMQMTSNTTSVNDVNIHASNLATIATIMDVVRYMDQPSRFGQNQLAVPQLPVDSNASMFSQRPTTPEPTPSTSATSLHRRFKSPGFDASSTVPRDNFLRDTASASSKRGFSVDVSEDRPVSQKSRIKYSFRSSDEMLTSSVSRKRPPAVKPTNPPPKRLRKDKHRTISTESSVNSEVDEFMQVSGDSHSTHFSASPPARPRSIVAHKKRGDVFLSGSGLPLRFFVQVDLHGRHTVVANIKKNKGKIVNNIADADYSILFTRSDTFQGLLSEAIALGKSPILAAFVADCVEEGALLDETDYIVDSTAMAKTLKRGRQDTFAIKVEGLETSHQTRKVKLKSTSESKKTGETPSADKKSRKVSKFAIPKPTTEDQDDAKTSRSPTPPAASTRQMMRNGRYLFTEAEDEYFLRLAKHHLTGDPTISNTALVCKLHKKMPHHTYASWQAHVDKKLKGALDGVRKRANIAKRKWDSGTENKNLPLGLVNESVPSEGQAVGSTLGNDDIPPDPCKPSQEELERQDFEVITCFFASGGGGDDDDDERVWRELEKHRQCRSASSWPEYYAAHQQQVYARIEELTKERAGD